MIARKKKKKRNHTTMEYLFERWPNPIEDLSAPSPSSLVKSPFPSASITTFSPTPRSLPHASITKASLTETHTMRSIPFSFTSSWWLRKPGTCCLEH